MGTRATCTRNGPSGVSNNLIVQILICVLTTVFHKIALHTCVDRTYVEINGCALRIYVVGPALHTRDCFTHAHLSMKSYYTHTYLLHSVTWLLLSGMLIFFNAILTGEGLFSMYCLPLLVTMRDRFQLHLNLFRYHTIMFLLQAYYGRFHWHMFWHNRHIELWVSVWHIKH